MKTIIEDDKYNIRIEPSDWRYSASIVGLIKYFDYHKSMGCRMEYNFDDDFLEYNSDDITEERYLLFVEYYFTEDMHHKIIEQVLSNSELTDEQINFINDKLKANTIIKNVFKGLKVTNENKGEIIKRINENRLILIKETYKHGKKLYANFANSNRLLSEKDKICRLLNYDIDTGKKSKSISYNWDFQTYNFEDEIEFDFIPFAFSKSREAFFINNNYSIKQLISTNDLIKDSENPRSTLFRDLKNSANFINFDVEVIVKNREEKTVSGKTTKNNYFETLYIRKDAIKIFEEVTDYKGIQINYKVTDDYYIDFEKEVTNNILNKVKLDDLIELLLKIETSVKSKKSYGYNIRTLIKINTLIYGGDKMDSKMKSAYASAKKVVDKIPENKVKNYKQKLISSIVFKDYERFCEILLQLSSYSEVVFDFAYDLFKDFDGNKNVAYTFINALNKNINKEKMIVRGDK